MADEHRDFRVLLTDPETGVMTVYELGPAVYRIEPKEPLLPDEVAPWVLRFLQKSADLKEFMRVFLSRSDFYRGVAVKK